MSFSLSALLLALVSWSAAAESQITLTDLVSEALERNPGLAASRMRWRAASEEPKIDRSLPKPNLSHAHAVESVETRGGPIKGRISVSQEIPFYGKRALRADVASKRAKIAEQAFRSKGLSLKAHVVRAYYDLYFLRRAKNLLGEQVELLRHAARVAEKKYAVRKGPQAVVFRAQAELSRIKNDVVDVEQEIASALAHLNTLRDREPWAAVEELAAPAFPSITWNAESLRNGALSGRPEILAARAMEGMSVGKRRLAFKEFFPDFQAGYEMTQIGGGTTNTSFDGRDGQTLSIGLRLPLWGGVNSAGYRKAKNLESAASFDKKDLENRTLFEVEDLRFRAEAQARMAKLDEETILPQIRAALSATRTGYESDSVGFLDLLDAEKALLDVELGHVRHVAAFHKIIAELERVVGGGI